MKLPLSFKTVVCGIEPPPPRLTVRRSTARPPLWFHCNNLMVTDTTPLLLHSLVPCTEVRVWCKSILKPLVLFLLFKTSSQQPFFILTLSSPVLPPTFSHLSCALILLLCPLCCLPQVSWHVCLPPSLPSCPSISAGSWLIFLLGCIPSHPLYFLTFSENYVNLVHFPAFTCELMTCDCLKEVSVCLPAHLAVCLRSL